MHLKIGGRFSQRANGEGATLSAKYSIAQKRYVEVVQSRTEVPKYSKTGFPALSCLHAYLPATLAGLLGLMCVGSNELWYLVILDSQ